MNSKAYKSTRIFQSVTRVMYLVILFIALMVNNAFTQGKLDADELTTENPLVRRVMEVQDRHTPALMAMENVNGTATGLTEAGELAILVLTITDAPMPGLPAQIEGIPVLRKVIGEVRPSAEDVDGTSLHKDMGTSSTTATIRYARPVPIGSSTGNWNDCGGGTLGVRVRRNTTVYVLSCNHVLARSNSGVLNDRAVQPGRVDVACAQNAADTIGRLADFELLRFGTGNTNTMDAAIVRTNPLLVSAATPANGYGTPSTTTVNPSLSMSVKKYGKTTGLTTGTIAAVNVSISINYSGGTAYFTGQIIVTGSGFVSGGDSGSLVVRNTSQNNPVGLVFAQSGTAYFFVSPISPILTRFNVVIDDGTITPLPVELSAFSGSMKGSDVHLKWRTETELQNYGFLVQRSTDKQDWETQEFISGAGDCYSPREYSHIDLNVGGQLGGMTLYYRLIQMDRDGTETLSSVLEISQRPVAPTMNVFPHPIRSDATLQLQVTEATSGAFAMYDAAGRRIEEQSRDLDLREGSHLLQLSTASLLPGTYFMEFTSPTGVVRKHVLVSR